MRYRPRFLGTLLALLAVGLIAPLAVTGCGAPGGGPAAAPAGNGSTAERLEVPAGPPAVPKLPVEADSADGRRVTVREAGRILPLSGSLAEIVFTLGLGDRVVGRDVGATFAEAAGLPLVTRGHEVSAESVLALRPDVVLVEDTTGPAEALDQIRAAGVPVVVFETPRELAAVRGRITAVAAALGVPEAGRHLADRTGQRIAEARERVPATAGGDRPRVAFLYLRGTASVYLLGGAGSGATSLIEAAGAVDAGAASGLTKDFTPITSEALVAAAPDVILVMAKGLESVGGVDGLLTIPGVAQTPAGMERRVAAVADGMLLNYGPRTGEVLASLVEQIHAP